jgi:PAS domain S-box-containing protein
MKKHSEEPPDWQGQRNKIIGLGESSIRKSYYPELQQKMAELEKKNLDLHAAYEELTSSEEELRQNYEELSTREHKLRESEEKYRNLVENTFDGVIIHRDKKVLFANRTATRLLGGAGPEELIGRPILDVVHPDYRAIATERATQALETTQLPRHEKFLHRDGTVFDVEVVAIPTTWEGAPAVQVAFRDITGLKRAEEALKESENFYRTLFETTGAASIIIDENTIVSRANEGYTKMTGYSREEIEGKRSWTEFIVPEDLERMKRYHQGRRITPSRVPAVYEFGFLDRRGNVRRCIVSVSMIPGTAQSVASFVDITERVIAEQELERKNRELRVSETRFRQVAESAGEWIWEVNENGLYTYASPIVEKILGYTPDELVGKKYYYDLFTPEEREQFRAGSPEVFTNRDPLRKIINHKIHKNGSRVILETSGTPIISETGQFLGYRGTGLDITERQRAEKALEQARKKLGLLNTVIFQDIHSTIFALSAYMQLASGDVDGAKAKSYAEKEVFLIHKIISSLDFARNYQELGLQPSLWQNVNRVFLYALSHLDSLKISRKIQLAGLEIYADPLLEKVFFNLAENVFLHGQRATEISFTYREDASGVLLIFQDNGIGIPAEDKKKIFERGYGKNTGLGLFLVREVLSITGISIQETGAGGEGARFEILVPKGSYRFSTVK